MFDGSSPSFENEGSFTQNDTEVSKIDLSGSGAVSARSIDTSSQISLGLSILIVRSPTLMTGNGPAATGASLRWRIAF